MKRLKRLVLSSCNKFLGLKNGLDNILGRFLFWMNDIQTMGSIRFFGLPHVRTSSSSKVLIGDACVFRSSPGSNLIGINRRCVVFVDTNANLIIGKGSGFSGTVIGCFDKIILGSNVRCGANTLITDSDWHPGDSRVGPSKPIEIGDNVWLGVDVKVLKGVTIGNNAVIGAGSIVVSDIPTNAIAAGNPCRVIRIMETDKFRSKTQTN